MDRTIRSLGTSADIDCTSSPWSKSFLPTLYHATTISLGVSADSPAGCDTGDGGWGVNGGCHPLHAAHIYII